ncbi:hypothetical protein SAMN06264364_1464 [Quadrisphaera granulorum]|uniref:Uncharacterized protein n=1 Tax=Quadrisphaera granulorum TaxID=317664 RepID=A0A315ZNN0_9ACTN|nr:hypothetical protein [Quadrisphaera granulorum]PWJ46478.1 hypothetical protein BXY45_1464 [Quadrisphaera granulorum]SZE99036.1 hypothetical protein SAMN06264364_1464 [Quadrisphaera granulorum]
MVSPLVSVPPAEVGLLLQRRSHPRLTAAGLLGLAARGCLRVECTSPNRFQVEPSWRLEVIKDDDDGDGSSGAGLRSHEERLLDAVRCVTAPAARTRRELRDLDDVDDLRSSSGLSRAERALRRDAAERGWLSPPPRRRPTASARALIPLALDLRERLLVGDGLWTPYGLALATALDALPATTSDVPPAASSDGDEAAAPVPGSSAAPVWLIPGRRLQDQSWSGALQFARALSAEGSGGGLDWTDLPELVGALLDFRS